MLVTYSPEGQDPQEFTFLPGRLKMSQQAVIERDYARLTGEPVSFIQFVQDVRVRAPQALRVLLHWCLRQVHPTIRQDDVDPYGDEIDIRFHKADIRSAYALIARIPDPEIRAKAQELWEEELAGAVDEAADLEPGKAAGSSSSSATRSSTAARSRKRGKTTT